MSESITYTQAQVTQATQVARLIAVVRDQSYDLNPNTMAYAHMVTEMLAPQAIAEVASTIEKAPDQAYARLALNPSNDIVGVGLGHKGELYDVLDNLVVLPQYQHEGIGGAILDDFLSWTKRDSQLWVIANNHKARILYVKRGFRDGRTYTDGSIEIKFAEMIRRQKRRRSAA